MKVLNLIQKKIKREQGLSMLEYAAGAAVLAGVVYGAMAYFGNGLEGFFQALGDWATSRASDVGSTGSSGTSPTP